MSDEIAQRIARELGISDLRELLADNLSGADFHSLLLAVLKRRVNKIEAAQMTTPNAVTTTCDLDGRLLHKLESIAYETAASFEAVELSPVTPLGAVKVLTGLDQANVLSTVRALECASDPTIGLALECARRRKNAGERKSLTRICTNQRVLRFPLPQNPAYTAHFKLFALVTAGRDLGSFAFEIDALREHIGFYLTLLSKLRMAAGFSSSDITVEISDTRAVSQLCSKYNIDRDEVRATVKARDSNSAAKLLKQYSNIWPEKVTNPEKELAEYNLPKHIMMQLDVVAQNVCAPLSASHDEVKFEFNMHRLTGLGYYEGPCFHIKVNNSPGQTFMLADGGFVAWTQNLLTDKKERLMTSAIGTEQLCRVFNPDFSR